jgi:hypothetical protein
MIFKKRAAFNTVVHLHVHYAAVTLNDIATSDWGKAVEEVASGFNLDISFRFNLQSNHRTETFANTLCCHKFYKVEGFSSITN